MMVINTNSWHCKLYDFYSRKRPSSLCVYFWKIVFGLALSASMIAALLVVCCLAGIDLAAYLLWTVGVSSYILSVGLGTVIGAIVLSSIYVAIAMIHHLLSKIGSKIYDARYKRYTEKLERGEDPARKNFLIQYIKARKEKVCPFIKFE